MTHLSLSRKGDRLLANCSDRVARLFEIAAASEPHPQPFGVDAAGTRIRTQKVCADVSHSPPNQDLFGVP